VKGELGARDAAAFEGVTISGLDGNTEMAGSIIDASRLQSQLVRIAGLGLTLISLTLIDTEERSSGHVRGPIDGIEPVMPARAGAVSSLIVTVALAGHSASAPWGSSTIHWPRSSRTSVADDPAPLEALEVHAWQAVSEGAHRILRYQRAALPAGQFSMTPTVSYPSRS
jgi:hypothetical protein